MRPETGAATASRYTLTTGEVEEIDMLHLRRQGQTKKEPTVVGKDLEVDNTLSTPTLTRRKPGELTRVIAPELDCRGPGPIQMHSEE